MLYPPKYPRSLHWPWSPTIHNDDKTHNDPEVFVGREVVISEKIDGSNTCLWQGEVYARSTAQPCNSNWMGMVKKHHAWKTLDSPKGLVFYGEDIFGVHSIKYDAVDESKTYRVFATRYVGQENQLPSDIFMSWDATTRLANEYNLLTVPMLFKGTFTSVAEINDWFEYNMREPSYLGTTREGFVIRWSDGFGADMFSSAIAKYVRPNHVQSTKHWKDNWQSCKLI